jgi:hypothetical protein
MTTLEVALTALLSLCGLALLGILYTSLRMLAMQGELLRGIRESQQSIVSILLRTTSDLLEALRALEQEQAKEPRRQYR